MQAQPLLSENFHGKYEAVHINMLTSLTAGRAHSGREHSREQSELEEEEVIGMLTRHHRKNVSGEQLHRSENTLQLEG